MKYSQSKTSPRQPLGYPQVTQEQRGWLGSQGRISSGQGPALLSRRSSLLMVGTVLKCGHGGYQILGAAEQEFSSRVRNFIGCAVITV